MNQYEGQDGYINKNGDTFQTWEKQQDIENKKLCANCNGKNNTQDVKQNLISINQIKQAKQFIQSDRSTQIQLKLQCLNNLNDSVEQLRSFYMHQIGQISQTIKIWQQQLLDAEDAFINKLQQEELIDFPLLLQFIKEQQYAQSQDQIDRIRQINDLILGLKETDIVKKCLSLLENNLSKPIRFESHSLKENKNNDEELSLFCEDHNKQITLFNLSSERSVQKRIGCLDCLDGTINQYTSIKRAQFMWHQISQKRIEKMNNHVEILKIKLNSIKGYFIAIQKGFNCAIDNALNKLSLNYEDYILQVNQTISYLGSLSWQSMTKEQMISIANDLSQINQSSILEDPLFDEFSIKENLVYEIAKDTMKQLQELQAIFFDQIIHLVCKQLDKNSSITLQLQYQSANNIASQSTDIIDQLNQNSIVLEHKQQEQQLSIQMKKSKLNIQDQQQSSQLISSKEKLQQFKPFSYKKIEKYSIKQNEFCRAIAFNKDCTLVVAGCNNLIKVFEFSQGQLKQIQVLSEHQNDVHTLQFMKKSAQFISGSADKSIKIWSLNQNNEWFCQQKLIGHTHYIRCMILDNTENLIITGSPDKTIKFWIKKNEWQCQQTITEHTSWISGLSLNEQQNRMISCGGDKQILILEQSQKNQIWTVIQQIMVEQYGDRLCFINNDLFTFQPYSQDTMLVFQRNNNHQYSKLKEIDVKGGSSGDSYLFPQQFIKTKSILLNKNGQNINILRQRGESDFINEYQIDFGTYYLFGQMTEDGEYLMTWDNKSTEIQIRRYDEL
ncbi:unnamed protein product (macronuclear) [Paramecium tetraurelia]|uniref:Uncharacterized protein n=1 Tax=Paramecium tetraurelia TaxID=5888 RepID=A0DAZ5_PARTE|nr:uncharacterized protein GSPATT00015119001 [Paramecium tetraurelia]CAK80212.1 unnamed protein product [Paramecium tetraurelia]|eukprot:XP_001447609.1 hypothetical protein (macronuclear) [Paramecium tetraurelia strain d4-2]